MAANKHKEPPTSEEESEHEFEEEEPPTSGDESEHEAPKKRRAVRKTPGKIWVLLSHYVTALCTHIMIFSKKEILKRRKKIRIKEEEK